MAQIRPPEELPATDRALLTAFRRQHAMPTPAKDRMLERLQAEDTVATSSTTRMVGAAVAIAAAVVLAWGVWHLRSESASRDEARDTADQAAMRAEHEASQQARERDEADAPATSEPSTHAQPDAPQPEAESVGEVEPNAVVDGEPNVAPQERDDEARPPRGGRPVAPRGRAPQTIDAPVDPGAAATTQVDRERAILAEAWTALAAGDHATARERAQAHAREFSHAILGVERDAIATIAQCQGKRPGWSDGADAFLDRHGKTPLASRVRTACGLETSPEKNDDGH